MKLLKVDTLEEAREKLRSITQGKQNKIQEMEITHALNYILAEDIYSPLDIPDFCRSTVDGYAVLAKDTWGAEESNPIFLTLIGEVEMGEEVIGEIRSGECMYVPTGGMLPAGADACVMVEYSENFAGDSIALHTTVAVGSNVVAVGEDVTREELVVYKGTRLSPGHIATLSAMGITDIRVYQPPAITILSTGDEIASPTEVKELGQVYDVNTYGLQAMAEQQHFIIIETAIVRDEEDLLRNYVIKAMASSDIVVVSGGSSEGKKDATKKILDEVSAPGVFTHGLALKPGKPTIIGYDQDSETILVGLPGHPVAAMLVFELILLAHYRERMKVAEEIPLLATLAVNLPGAPGKTTCQLVKVVAGAEEYLAHPLYGKSGLITTLKNAHGYILIPHNQEGLTAGEQVKVWRNGIFI